MLSYCWQSQTLLQHHRRTRRGAGGGWHVPPPPKKKFFTMSGKAALVGNERPFCRNKGPRDQSFTEELSNNGMGWGCRHVSKLSGKSASVGNDRWFCYYSKCCSAISEWSTLLESIPADHRLIHCYQLLHFAVVQWLVITVQFDSSLDQNPVLPTVSLEIPTPSKWLESAWNAGGERERNLFANGSTLDHLGSLDH